MYLFACLLVGLYFKR